MHTFTDILLKPLWQALASPGLGNPHSPYEAQLMLAGVKPVAIMSARMGARMEEGLRSGHVVHIADKSFEQNYRLYFDHRVVGSANVVIDIIKDNWREHEAFPHDTEFLSGLFGYADNNGENVEKHTMSVDERFRALNKSLGANEPNQDVADFLDGKILALPPIRIHEHMRVPDELNTQHRKGSISALHYSTTQNIQVYALASKAEEGRELFARYYESDTHEYPRMKAIEESARIGELLGFTDNDIAWHLGTKYQSPMVLRFMEATVDIRQHARLKTMLWDSPIGVRDLTL